MDGRIKLSPTQMRQRAAQYSDQADEINFVTGELDNLLDRLMQEWKGNASRAYCDKYCELRHCFTDAESLIRRISQSLENTATSLETTDNDIGNAYKN